MASRKTFREIVDGQQRSKAIFDFFGDAFRLSRTLETEDFRCRRYSDLDEEDQTRFVDYPLSADVFVAASPDEIRETFRRMNSYTIPLNPEEQRHAIFQGEMKWFIRSFAERYDGLFLEIALFGEKQLVRMLDTKLLSEVCHAILYGMKTTNKKSLDDLYRERNKEFPERDAIDAGLSRTLDIIGGWKALENGSLMRHHIVYSLVLATYHILLGVDNFEEIVESPKLTRLNDEVVVRNLSILSEALERPEDGEYVDFGEFVDAASDRTNVKAQREIRFRWFCRALSGEVFN